MVSRDLRSNISPAQSIQAAAVTATVNGSGVDLRDYGSAAIIIALGTFAGTTPSATVKIQESDDDSAYTDVAAADLQGGALPGIDTSNDAGVIERGYIGGKRYIRVAVTAISGAGASLPLAAVIVRGHPHLTPAS